MTMSLFTKAALAALCVAGIGGGSYLVLRGTGEEKRPERPPTVVQLAPVRAEELVRRVEAIGTVSAINSVDVSTEAAGRLMEVPFEQGQQVAQGDVLARLDPDEAEAAVASAHAEAAEIAQAVQRGEQLLQTGNTPRATVEDARRRLQGAMARVKSAESQLDEMTVRAPFAGRVGLRRVSVGAVVAVGTVLTTLDELDPIALRFTVPEQEIGRITPGIMVEAASPAFVGRTFEGKVHALDGRVDPATRTIAVEARLPNPAGELRPGMLMNLRVAVERVAGAVVVPPRAVLLRGESHFVFKERDGKVKRVEIRVGVREAERIEVLEGLQPGDRIVVEGGDQLSDGQAVRVSGRDEAKLKPGA